MMFPPCVQQQEQSADNARCFSKRIFLLNIFSLCGIKITMTKRSLQETNPHIKDPEKRKRCLIQTVVSSTVIEGVCATDAMTACAGMVIIPNPSRNSANSGKSRRQKSAS